MEPVMDNPQTLIIRLTPQEFALVWAALGKQPAESVFSMMENLKSQVQTQEGPDEPNRPQ